MRLLLGAAVSEQIPDFEIPASTCPSCGYRMDRAGNLTGKGAPEPGDLTMCFGCAEVLAFNDDMTHRVVAPEEFLDLPMEVRRMFLRLREVHAKVKGRKGASP